MLFVSFNKNLFYHTGSCNTTQYWESKYPVCLDYKLENESCSSTYQCSSPMDCTNSICTCGQYKYHNDTLLTCENQTDINTTCHVDKNCRLDLGLACSSGSLCKCATSNPIWSNSSGRCIKPYNYSESCNDTSECDQSLNLFCNNASTTCNCPTALGANKCDCVKHNNSEWYWNGTSCVLAGAYGQTCEAGKNYSCQTIKEATMCDSSAICTCGSNGGLKNSTGRCVSCETNWYFIKEYCYKSGTVPGRSSTSGSNGNIDTSCGKSALSSDAQATVRLAKFQDSDVRNFFLTNVSQTNEYYVDASDQTCSGSQCYVSNDGLWTLNFPTEWCQTTTTQSCVYFNVTLNCFMDTCCNPGGGSCPSIDRNHACQYEAVLKN